MSSEYIVYDWVGYEDFLEAARNGGKVPGTKFRDEQFSKFMGRLPIALEQLQILAPEINLDYSLESLERLDDWVKSFLVEHVRRHRTSIPYYRDKLEEKEVLMTRFNALDGYSRSVLSDAYAYFGECQIKACRTLEWKVNAGKNAAWPEAGFPGLFDSATSQSAVRCSLGGYMDFASYYSKKMDRYLSLAEGFKSYLGRLEHEHASP
jgi:hypothetical protein